MRAFLRYLMEQSPHRAAEFEELEELLVDKEGFEWKDLSVLLRNKGEAMDTLKALGVKGGLVLSMYKHVDGFRRQWEGQVQVAGGLEMMRGHLS